MLEDFQFEEEDLKKLSPHARLVFKKLSGNLAIRKDSNGKACCLCIKNSSQVVEKVIKHKDYNEYVLK